MGHLTWSLDDVREAVLQELTVHGLSIANLNLLRRHTSTLSASSPIFISDLTQASPKDLRSICELLDDQLGTTLLPRFEDLFRSGRASFFRVLRKLLATILLVGVSYLVIGATLEGRSSLSSSPLVAFALLALLLFILAVFEAMHIVVTVLRLSDLSSLGDNLQRIREMHRVFRWEEGTRRYLAGRQFAVVSVVFLISRLTTYSGHTWPLTKMTMPPPLTLLCFEYGLAGALFTLWWGQLVPQFLANRRPLWFGNLAVCKPAFVFGNVVEQLGVTTPADWVVALDKSPAEAEIPISPQRRYRQAAHTLEGSGHLGIKKTWELSADGKAVAVHTVYTHVAVDNIDKLAIQGPIISDSPPERLLGQPVLLRNTINTPIVYDLQNVPVSNFEQQVVVVSPRVGWFRPGDILHTEFELKGSDPGCDRIVIVGPTQHLLFRLSVTNPPETFAGVAVTMRRLGQDLGIDADDTAKGKITHRWIRPVTLDDGSAVAEEFFPYPDVGALYEFRWSVEW
jgi:hypothetical protein